MRKLRVLADLGPEENQHFKELVRKFRGMLRRIDLLMEIVDGETYDVDGHYLVIDTDEMEEALELKLDGSGTAPYSGAKPGKAFIVVSVSRSLDAKKVQQWLAEQWRLKPFKAVINPLIKKGHVMNAKFRKLEKMWASVMMAQEKMVAGVIKEVQALPDQ